MSLLNDWENIAYIERNEKEYNDFWNEYLSKEKNIYKILLSENNNIISGCFHELAKKYSMSNTDFIGFMSGINSSLVDEINLEELEENSTITAKIDFEKLYYNMHEAQADWLYNLPEWDSILSKEKRKEISKEYNKSKIVVNENKIGRNDPCPCGSGKKYKKCCGK